MIPKRSLFFGLAKTKFPQAVLFFHWHPTCHISFFLLDVITRITRDEDYKLWCSSCTLQPPLTSRTSGHPTFLTSLVHGLLWMCERNKIRVLYMIVDIVWELLVYGFCKSGGMTRNTWRKVSQIFAEHLFFWIEAVEGNAALACRRMLKPIR